MSKFLIGLSILVIIFIYFNYPFQSEGISFLIVFVCLVVILFATIKLWTAGKLTPETYESAEKEIEKRHKINGKFKYEKDGFHFTRNGNTEFIKWEEIIEVNSFSIPTGKWTQQSGLEIIANNKSYEFNDENTAGIEKLGDKLFDNLPNWKLDADFVRVNNYGLEKANLYRREENGSG